MSANDAYLTLKADQQKSQSEGCAKTLDERQRRRASGGCKVANYSVRK